MADKDSSSADTCAYLRKRGIKAVIPAKEDQKGAPRPRQRGRPPAPPSTPGVAKSATPSSAVSPSASSSAPSRPGATSPSPSTRPPPTSLRPAPAYAIPPPDPL